MYINSKTVATPGFRARQSQTGRGSSLCVYAHELGTTTISGTGMSHQICNKGSAFDIIHTVRVIRMKLFRFFGMKGSIYNLQCVFNTVQPHEYFYTSTTLTCMCVHVLWFLYYTERDVLDDPMFRNNDKYYLSGEKAFDRIVEKYVHFNYIKRRKSFREEEINNMRV